VSDRQFIASFDIEEWFHAENLRSSLSGTDWNELESRVERNTHKILDILADVDAKATFFVLGWIARRYPDMVLRMIREGHEVASHTDRHFALHRLSRPDLMTELVRSRDTLEQLSGAPVRGIRAPMFSISDAVLDAVAEAGYWYDSSYFAFGAHDRYGHLSELVDPELPALEVRPGLLELPMSRLVLGPLALPWAGGGYFRLIPYAMYRAGVAHRLDTKGWFMFYFHPWELDHEETPPASLGSLMRFRAYVGRSRMRADLRRLLAEFGSVRIDEALRARGLADPGGEKLASSGGARA